MKLKSSLISTDVKDGAMDVRQVPLDPSRVESYRAAKQAGAKFPAIIVTKKDDRYLIVDGRTRFAADLALGRDYVDVDVVTFAKPADFIYAAIAANTNNGVSVAVPPTAADYRVCARKLFDFGVSPAAAVQKLSAIKGIDESFIGPLVKSEYGDCKRRNILHATDCVAEHLRSEGARGRSLDDAAVYYGIDKKVLAKSIEVRQTKTSSTASDRAREVGVLLDKARRYCKNECQFPKDWKMVRQQAERFFEWTKAQEVSNTHGKE